MAERGAARPWLAPAVWAALTAAAWGLYQTAPPSLARWIVFPYAAGLVLGPGVVYWTVRRRGGSIPGSLAAGLCVPLLWLLKEGYRVTAVFSIGEAAYYALNPLSLGLFTAAAFQIALAELGLRRARTGRWPLRSGPAVALATIGLLAAGFGLAARGSGGREVFYAYIAIYRMLFGDG